MPKHAKPTLEQFKQYQAAYDYFNRELFDNALRPCLLVFRDGKVSKRGVVMGHFAPKRWAAAGAGDDAERTHEISLNPETLAQPLEETFGTLVHEMAHQWQQDHGKPPRAGYHDRQWAAKMADIGLIASNTGRPGGRQTGQQMTHYVDPHGGFRRAMDAMPASIKLPWVSGRNFRIDQGTDADKEARKKKNKLRYTCPCEQHVWGKPELSIVCGDCGGDFEAEEQD